MFLVLLGVAIVLFWATAKRRPLYRKAYLATRGDGAFRTEYEPGFEEYLDYVGDEVRARLLVGPFSPSDDLAAELYHPELTRNWKREFGGTRLVQTVIEVADVAGYVIGAAFIADAATRLVTHGGGLFALDQKNSFEKLLGIVFAGALLLWMHRRAESEGRTQGYLDGWSDRCRKAKSQTIVPEF